MFRLVFALLYNLLQLLGLPLSLLRRRLAVRPGTWLVFDIDGSVAEFARRRLFRSRPDLATLREALKRSQDDRRIAGLKLALKRFGAGSASALALHAEIVRYRRAGKRVVAYLPDGASAREYAVASAAEVIVLGRHSHISALGFAIQTPYFKRGLEKLGVTPEVFARGEYKTAGEPLLRESMSEAQREQLNAVLDETFGETVRAISEGRGQARERVEHWMDDGPWAPQRALRDGLVDDLAYDDELDETLKGDSGKARSAPVRRYVARTATRWMPLSRPRYLGVVNVHGVIVGEANGPGRVADEASFIKSVDRVREDPRALGLALHIDSRGGSALASARMLHAVRRCASAKPVVAYFNDVAASGGYMIGVGAHEIVAQALTITGSIGVVAARVVLGPLFERLGIDWETLKRGARADMLSPTQPMDEAERAAFMDELEEHYASFVAVVAEGRNKSVDEIETVARGRVWTGRAAVGHGLVDAEGSFEHALERLRQRVGPRGAAARPRLVSVSVAPKLPSLVAPSAHAAELLLADCGRELAELCADKRRDRVWAWAPFY